MYKYETHLHTSPVSKCARATVRESLEFYKNIGYDGVFITNHFIDGNINVDRSLPYAERIEFYFSDYETALELSKEIGISVFCGVEMSYGGTDFLVYGLKKDWYLAHPEIEGMKKSQLFELLKADGALIIQAHPFRDGMQAVDPSLLDGIEVFNLHPNHNSRVGLASVYAKEQSYHIVTAGSDFHHPDRKHEGVSAILTKTLPCDSFALADILKSGDYLLEAGRNNIIIP